MKDRPMSVLRFEPTEAQIQHACIELLRQLTIPVYRVGQRDARGAQDPGVSDLIVLSPTYGTIFAEVKTKSGAQSAAQRQFMCDVEAAGGRYELVRSCYELACLLGGS